METTTTTPADETMAARPALPKSNRPVDLTQVQNVPFAWVDEHVYAAIRGCSVKVIQRERQENIGCPYKKVNGKSVRYKMAHIMAFLEAQPGGGGELPGADEPQGPGRPRKATA